MSSPAQILTEEEKNLLRAAVDHAKAGADGPHLGVRRIPYGFEINPPVYGDTIVGQEHKEKWEAALKRLVADSFLQRTEAANQSWSYFVTEKGFAAVSE